MRGHADNDRRKKRVQLLLSKIIQIPVSMLLLHCYGEEKKLEWKIAHHMFKKSRRRWWNIIKYIQIFAHTYKKNLYASFIFENCYYVLNRYWKLEYYWIIFFFGLINTNMYILRAGLYIEISTFPTLTSPVPGYYTFFLILFKCKIYPEKRYVTDHSAFMLKCAQNK